MDTLHTLCIAKEDHVFKNTTYKINTNYRVSFDEKGTGRLVYGEWMTKKQFDKRFELYIPILQERLKSIGLILNGKPAPFRVFKKLVDIHNYGTGKRTIKIIFIGHPKENMFGFYPMQGANPVVLKEAYEMFVALAKGEFEDVDCRNIQWGNCGIPICYGDLRRDEKIYKKK